MVRFLGKICVEPAPRPCARTHFLGLAIRRAIRHAGSREHLLNAYEYQPVSALPRYFRACGITEATAELLSLGMTMPQLIDAARFNPAQTLWAGDALTESAWDEYVANEVHLFRNAVKHPSRLPILSWLLQKRLSPKPKLPAAA